jgi:hypothetical protein
MLVNRKRSRFFRKSTDERRQPGQSLTPASEKFSNQRKSERFNAVVILFDLLNMGYETRSVAANHLVRDLRSLEQADNLYLYLLSVSGKLLAAHGIAPQESAVPPAAQTPWTQQIKPVMDAGMRAVMGFRSPDIDVFVRTQYTFAALQALGEELGARLQDHRLGDGRRTRGPGRESLRHRLSDRFHSSDPCAQPNTGTIQYRTLSGGSGHAGECGRYRSFSGAGATGGAGTEVQSLATLDLFADLTGGRRSTTKNIGGAVRQAMNDLRFFYQIGYDVPPANWDDRLHKLRVTSKRKGIRIQAQGGYFAWKGAAGTRTQSAFTATAGASFDAEEIGLWANVSSDPPDPDRAEVKLRIDARDIALAESGDRYTAHLGVTSVGYMPNGFIATGPVMPLDIDYSAAERDQALRNDIPVVENLDASQGQVRFRVMVFDRGSNAVGSITIPASALRPAQP